MRAEVVMVLAAVAGWSRGECPARHALVLDERQQESCVECPANCEYCSGQDRSGRARCDYCGERFFIEGGECARCAEHCAYCFGPDLEHCLTLVEGRFFNFTTRAVDACADPGCGYCTERLKCSSCRLGFLTTAKEDGSVACASCEIDNCNYCTRRSDQIKAMEFLGCDVCAPRFALAQNRCLACPDGCDYCDEPGNCLSCQGGLAFSKEQGRCVEPASPNCAAAQDGKCVECRPGDFLADGACRSCAEVDRFCTFCGVEAARPVCIDCRHGFAAVDNKCVQCGDNCEICTESQCQLCYPGFFMQDGACHRCALDHCDYCNDAERCGGCKSFFFPDADGRCRPCGDHCMYCSAENNCSNCSMGWLLLANDRGEFACVQHCPPGFDEHFDGRSCLSPAQVSGAVGPESFDQLEQAVDQPPAVGEPEPPQKSPDAGTEPAAEKEQPAADAKAEPVAEAKAEPEQREEQPSPEGPKPLESFFKSIEKLLEIPLSFDSDLFDLFRRNQTATHHQLRHTSRRSIAQILHDLALLSNRLRNSGRKLGRGRGSEKCSFRGRVRKEIRGEGDSFYRCVCDRGFSGEFCAVPDKLRRFLDHRVALAVAQLGQLIRQPKFHSPRLLLQALTAVAQLPTDFRLQVRALELSRKYLRRHVDLDHRRNLFLYFDLVLTNLYKEIEQQKLAPAATVEQSQAANEVFRAIADAVETVEDALERAEFFDFVGHAAAPPLTSSFAFHEFPFTLYQPAGWPVRNPNIENPSRVGPASVVRLKFAPGVDHKKVSYSLFVVNFSHQLFGHMERLNSLRLASNVLYIKTVDVFGINLFVKNTEAGIKEVLVDFVLAFVPAFDDLLAKLRCVAMTSETGKSLIETRPLGLDEENQTVQCGFEMFFEFKKYYFAVVVDAN